MLAASPLPPLPTPPGAFSCICDKNERVIRDLLDPVLSNRTTVGMAMDLVYQEDDILGDDEDSMDTVRSVKVAALMLIGNLSMHSDRTKVRNLFKYRETEYSGAEHSFVARAMAAVQSIGNKSDLANLLEGLNSFMDFKRNRILFRRIEGPTKLEELPATRPELFVDVSGMGRAVAQGIWG